MLDWLKRLNLDRSGLDRMSEQFSQMLDDGRHAFDAAANALLGGTDPEVIRADLFATDERINETERTIRRELVVHGAVHGSATVPALLVLMSLVKDAERIGDYAKNIFDLAEHGVALVGSERKELVRMKDETSKLLIRGKGLYLERDTAGAERFLIESKAVEDRCDDAIDRLLTIDAANMAGAVLTYRYFKRVVSHVKNIVTSIVMPVDLLDFYDEPHDG